MSTKMAQDVQELRDVRAHVLRLLGGVGDVELLRMIAWVLDGSAKGLLDISTYRARGGRGYDVETVEAHARVCVHVAKEAVLSRLGFRPRFKGLPLE